ncbi:MAG: hypothetical protein M1829_001616 [Trizodia sp. TS-e1964]|nr:MAG: hypothetical protein M1829_001616 [Trizodia sp. TS-e1964]
MDHDDMALDPVVVPISRGVSSEPGPRRDSMEDADQSSHRKRQRLDSSSDRRGRSMSTDRGMAAAIERDISVELVHGSAQRPCGERQSPSQTAAQDDHNPSAVAGAQMMAQMMAQSPTTPTTSVTMSPGEQADDDDNNDTNDTNDPSNGLPHQTPSKVTINVRPSRPESSNSPQTVGRDVEEDMLASELPADADHLAKNMPASDSSVRMSPTTFTPNLSPSLSARSPEVEIAEVEDMDHDYAASWAPVVSVVDEEGQLADIYEHFPLVDQHRGPRDAAIQLAQILEKGDVGDGSIIVELASWISEFLRQTEHQEASWYEIIAENAQFWELFPNTIECLLRRANAFGPRFMRGPSSTHASNEHSFIRTLFISYSELAKRFVQTDLYMIEQHPLDPASDEHELISPRHVQLMGWILGPGIPLYLMARKHYNYNVDDTVASVIASFTASPEPGISLVSQLVRHLFLRAPHCARMVKEIDTCISLVHKMLMISNNQNNVLGMDPDLFSDASQEVPHYAAIFFNQLDSGLKHLVEKQMPIFVSDALLEKMHRFLLDLIASDPDVAQALALERVGRMEEIHPEDMAQLIIHSWKFSMMKKYFTSGVMPIKVQGVTKMCEDLVALWKKYNSGDPEHPVMRFLANFILTNRLVQHIVGVDSHSELITPSANIIGFLVATNNYTTTESDIIWERVASSQDPRVVGAILAMLKEILHIFPYPLLIHLCGKLNELPLDAFDAKMIDFGRSLFENINHKFLPGEEEETVESPPYDLCIRLIRQSGAISTDTDSVYVFAVRQLVCLLASAPSSTNRKRIYLECVNDVQKKSPGATGSICAINALLNQNYEKVVGAVSDIEMLTQELDLTTLAIEEFCHGVELQRSKPATHNILSHFLVPRLELLNRIMQFQPSTIAPELGKLLWEHLVGRSAIGNAERNAAWVMLQKVTNLTMEKNAFIDCCIHDFLPRLSPEFFIEGVLTFVQESIQYETRHCQQLATSEHEIINLPGVDQLWRIIVTAIPGSIENPAIQYLVNLYLDTPAIKKAPRSAVEATHLALVDKCIQQLTTAALKLKSFSDGTMSGEDEPMVIVASEGEIQSVELCFTRSLRLLSEIIRGMKVRPHYCYQSRYSPEPPLLVEEINGEQMLLRYQAITTTTQAEIRNLIVGDLETIDQLRERVSKATGFKNFNAYHGGCPLNFKETPLKTLRELRINTNPFILVRKIQDPGEVQEDALSGDLSIIELEVLKHFDALHELLGLEDRLAQDVWHFLIAFPAQEKIRKAILSKSLSIGDVFPPGAPYKILYSIYTLRTCLEDQLQKGIENEGFITRGVTVLVAALTSNNFHEGSSDEHLKIILATNVVDCLLKFLKEPVSSETSAKYFSDEAVLVDRLLAMLKVAKSPSAWNYPESVTLTLITFSTLLEASLHNLNLWNVFQSRADVPMLILQLILEDQRVDLRRGTTLIISNICKVLPSSAKVNTGDFAMFFWRLFVGMIPQIKRFPTHSEQFLESALIVFRNVGEIFKESLALETYIQEWGAILINHKHEEFVGRESVDYIVFGLTRLLIWCIRFARSLKKSINVGTLPEDIFNCHLFPCLSSTEEGMEVVERVPVLHSHTRQRLCELISILSQDTDTYQKILGLVSDLVPSNYTYDLTWNFDRSKSIRSPTGYVGLRNLSNTCYLNSLITQVYMNVDFRAFMLEANVADADSQRLLAETQRLFAHMQNSWQKCVEPKELANAIRTYENENIDVTVQMDVDEFYSLLFDRWEGQILSQRAKEKFRSFYGGQLVQQVKSKDCPHISEREEPFSAIQCEVKGKLNLQDSLKAYVEGEVMEGENKYRCTSCNALVNAVKRTCLKEVPDNLIFHLKRFDFDLRTMLRSKINDHFEFPRTIDMKPYKVAHLSDPSTDTPNDIFELVGVLIHQGTAESGHYYSYIRERPAATFSPTPTWVEFNDSDVSPFDPTTIDTACFGGLETWPQTKDSQAVTFPKPYSAYMLFYQRSTALRAQQEMEPPLQRECPKKLSMPIHYQNYLALENELYLRKYCLYDPFHAPFTIKLLENLRHQNKGLCSDNHAIEKTAIWLSLHHMDQIIARTKDMPDFDGMMTTLQRTIGSCTSCCRVAVDWVCTFPEAMRNLLLRTPIAKTRLDFTNMIVTALCQLRRHASHLYGFDLTATDPVEWVEGFGAFHHILDRLVLFWNYIGVSLRAWDDYFGLLVRMAQIGLPEATTLLRNGFLKRTLEILLVESHTDVKHDHGQIYRLLEKGRKPIYVQLIELLRILLSHVDLTEQPVNEDERSRYPNAELYPPSRRELYYIQCYMPKPKTIKFLNKIFDTNHNPAAASAIVGQMAAAEPQLGLLTHLYKTLLHGIVHEPANVAGNYLQAAIAFFQNAPGPSEVKELISRTATGIDSIGAYCGKEHIEFFKQIPLLRNDRVSTNQLWFHFRVLENAQFWAPHLLLYWDAWVRNETRILLNFLIFNHGHLPSTGSQRLDSAIVQAAKDLAQRCFYALDERFIKTRSQAEAKLVEEIIQVIAECRSFHEEDEDEEFFNQYEVVISHMDKLMVEDIEDGISGMKRFPQK